MVRADVLERLPDGGWRLVEVKSTTKLKELFVLHVAVQLWVLRGAGLDVREAGVLTLNRDYVYDGVRLDVDARFKLHPVFDEAVALLEGIGGEAQKVRAMLAESAAPTIVPGDHCFTPYNCLYYAHTTRDMAGGINEMCWHLFTWGESVTVEKPARLRRRLAAMCGALAAHHSAV